MPRLSKKDKILWQFFIGPDGRRKFNEMCRKCVHGCKQSFRAIIVCCPRFLSKRSNETKE